ncbi:hypothetical protein HNO53_09335 [Billgrantia antri]|uniref:Flippase-like domain-containing protein n=1 Tax=Halomonas sulfidivorans TaxID=2733488 RepID=A0ABX7WG93_9GAMM|nr:hypothetical protein [Halomonas sulfidivorans]QTP58890.1 hypothetical protein HNO53_09335 [Halomonas sulfidivorans]
MVKNFQMKRLLHLFGGGVGLLGVVFVLLKFDTYSDQIDFSRFHVSDWLIVVLLSLFYGVANILLAHAWWHLLLFNKVKPRVKWAILTYGLSQLAKYVPGNIFHLAGRQALGMAAGFPARALAKSALWELGLIVMAGAIFGPLVVPLVWSELSYLMSYTLFCVVAMTLIFVISHWFSRDIAAALICQIIFLTISGVIFILVLSLVVPNYTVLPSFPALCAAYVIAWLAGLVTPGAPAGIGVREVVLLFFLGGVIGPADLLLAVLLGRVVTIAGDLFYFSASWLSSMGKNNESIS